jgi:hypothetical protein
MTAFPPPLLNLQLCRENEVECLRLSLKKGTSSIRRIELIGMAENWSRLIKAAEAEQ